MDLNEITGVNDKTEVTQTVAAADSISPANEVAAFLNIFRRHWIFWLLALWRYRLIIIALPILLGCLFAVLRLSTRPKTYRSTCALLRQDIPEFKAGDLGLGFRVPQLDVVKNMLYSGNTLDEVLRRMNLKWSRQQLVTAIKFNSADSKNSNYLNLTVTTTDPELSARLANTIAEVFVELYATHIRTAVGSNLNSVDTDCKNLSREVSKLQLDLANMCKENGITSFDEARSRLNNSIASEETYLSLENTELRALQSRLSGLEAQLVNMPEDVVVYSETNVNQNVALQDARVKLTELEQMYTPDSPKVIKQREVVKKLEADELAHSKDEAGKSKEVIGRNQEYINVKTDISRTRGDIIMRESSVKQRDENLIALKSRMEMLNKLAPKFSMLAEQIEQKKTQLNRQEDIRNSLSMFLNRKFSDINLYEKALPPSISEPRRIVLFGVLGAFLGGALAVAAALLREALNLSVRSRVDIEKGLQIKALTVIPMLSPEVRADFYSALQSGVSLGRQVLNHTEIPALITVVPVFGAAADGKLQEEFESMMAVRDIRSLRICMAKDNKPEQLSHLINDFLYGLSDQLPPPTANDELFFKLDDMAFMMPPTLEQLWALRNALSNDYSVVLWQLFAAEEHLQLFLEICRCADMTLIPMKYAVSSKLKICNLLMQLHENHIMQIYGLLFGVDTKLYRRVK